MKKNYISPVATEICIEAEAMIAASLGFYEDEIDSDFDQLSNKRRGEWGNIWNK